ncbi:MAG: MOSC domain-containing protein [Actinobacteria bacterium]|nr:MAG: MOSC domain-containing protein [Actinomycetota bacterium]
MVKGQIVSINVSPKKGTKKTPVSEAKITSLGIEEDGHRGDWHRQVSLLAEESIMKMQGKGLNVKAGDFAENITTQGIDLLKLPIGTRIRVGESLLEVTQIGKECDKPCAIYYQAGDCIMPKEGIFAKVIKEGNVRVGDEIQSSCINCQR